MSGTSTTKQRFQLDRKWKPHPTNISRVLTPIRDLVILLKCLKRNVIHAGMLKALHQSLECFLCEFLTSLPGFLSNSESKTLKSCSFRDHTKEFQRQDRERERNHLLMGNRENIRFYTSKRTAILIVLGFRLV